MTNSYFNNILINNEDIEIICKQFKDIISHIHISQPNLSPINFLNITGTRLVRKYDLIR